MVRKPGWRHIDFSECGRKRHESESSEFWLSDAPSR